MIQLSIEAVPVQHHRERNISNDVSIVQPSAAGSEVGDWNGSTPIDENVNGWVWMPVRGWLELPLDAAIDTTETLDAKVWHRDRAVWMYVTARGLSAATQPAEPVDNNKSWYMNSVAKNLHLHPELGNQAAEFRGPKIAFEYGVNPL